MYPLLIGGKGTGNVVTNLRETTGLKDLLQKYMAPRVARSKTALIAQLKQHWDDMMTLWRRRKIETSDAWEALYD